MNPREQFEGRQIPAFGKVRKDCLLNSQKTGIKVRSWKATGKGTVMAEKTGIYIRLRVILD